MVRYLSGYTNGNKVATDQQHFPACGPEPISSKGAGKTWKRQLLDKERRNRMTLLTQLGQSRKTE
jgi:hypothetical protein